MASASLLHRLQHAWQRQPPRVQGAARTLLLELPFAFSTFYCLFRYVVSKTTVRPPPNPWLHALWSCFLAYSSPSCAGAPGMHPRPAADTATARPPTHPQTQGVSMQPTLRGEGEVLLIEKVSLWRRSNALQVGAWWG